MLGLLLSGPPAQGMAPSAEDLARGSAVQGAAYCENLLVNPGFETPDFGWTRSGVESPPLYTTDRAYQGNWSMRLGIVGTSNVASISAVQQTVDIPDFTETLSLKLRYWPISGDNAGNDLQYIDIYNGYNNQFIRRVWSDTADMAAADLDGNGDVNALEIQSTEWLFQANDLTDIKSSTNRIRLFFAVTNDGGGGATALYLDAVELLACDSDQGTPAPTATPTMTRTPTATPSGTPSATPSGTASHTPTPTVTGTPSATPSPTATPIPVDTSTPTPVPSATPIPTGCVNVVLNGGFESADGWTIGKDPYQPRFVSEPGQNGARSLRLGTPPGGEAPTVVTYSSVRQLVTIPSIVQTAKLTYRIKYRTEQAEDPSPSNVSDRQELVLLNPDLSTIAIPTRVLFNRENWTEESFQLFDYIGDTFFIYFNVYNDGNGARTWAYLDDVSLTVCYPDAPTATVTPMSVDAATSTPTPTPTPTLTVTAEMGVAGAGESSVLETQAAILSTQAAGTPTTVPSRTVVGGDVPSGVRVVTPDGQITPTLVPVSDAQTGMRFNNLSGFTVMLLVIGGFLVIALIILGVARALTGRSGGAGRGP